LILNKVIYSILSIADKKSDSQKNKLEHRFLVYLGLAMSIGGIVWGSITLSNDMYIQSLIPYSYTIITFFNFIYLYKSKDFKTSKNIQVIISLLIPFLFQLALGGFIASGAVMLWSIPIILVNFTFQNNNLSIRWFYVYILIVLASAILDNTATQYAINIDKDISILFFALNISLVSIIIFILFFYFINVKENLQIKLEQLNSTLEAKVTKQVQEITKSVILFETIFNTVEEGIAMLDLNSNIILVNKAYEKITGFTKEELLSKSIIDIFNTDAKENIKKIIEKVKVEKHYEGYEEEIISHDGRLTNLKIDFIFINERNSILLVTRDITQEKLYEKNRIEQEQTLLQHSRMAQMGEMISMIAHQWRQPLGAISTTTGNLKLKIILEEYDFNTEEGTQKFNDLFISELDNIEEYVTNLTVTIDDFRNFYKPNKKLTNTTLESIIKKSLNIIKDSLSNDSIKIIEEHDCHESLDIYDTEMMQVILNLLKNSQDNFIEKNIQNPYIKIKTTEKTIYLSDNGGGIEEETIKKIFDPYFSTKSEKNGTGLGLHMSKIIVDEHHNGNLSVVNTQDGVCFKIELYNS